MPNPMMRDSVYENAQAVESKPMTITGTVNKTILLLALVLIAGLYTWSEFFLGHTDKVNIMMIAGAAFGFITAIVTAFRPQNANVLAPFYAVCEGFFLGGISAMYSTMVEGIVVKAVILTFTALFVMLALYRFNLIKATPMFRKVIITATLSVAILYVVSIVTRLFFHAPLNFLYDSSPLSIGLSLVIIAIASFNFILDFDFIERGAASYAPKHLEWYGSFSMLVTLVWVYLEFLRLLSKLQRR